MNETVVTPCLVSSDLAAWVQAVGSVIAILVAVWVPWDQSRRQRRREDEREREELAALLRCLRSDLTTILAHIRGNVGTLFEAPFEDPTFRVVLPLSEDPFVVFNCLIPKLCLIRDDELRTQIVHTYGAGKGLVLTFRYNNELIECLDRAEEEFQRDQSDWNKTRVDRCRHVLSDYGVELRSNYEEVTRDADKLLGLLSTV